MFHEDDRVHYGVSEPHAPGVLARLGGCTLAEAGQTLGWTPGRTQRLLDELLLSGAWTVRWARVCRRCATVEPLPITELREHHDCPRCGHQAHTIASYAHRIA